MKQPVVLFLTAETGYCVLHQTVGTLRPLTPTRAGCAGPSADSSFCFLICFGATQPSSTLPRSVLLHKGNRGIKEEGESPLAPWPCAAGPPCEHVVGLTLQGRRKAVRELHTRLFLQMSRLLGDTKCLMTLSWTDRCGPALPWPTPHCTAESCRLPLPCVGPSTPRHSQG